MASEGDIYPKVGFRSSVHSLRKLTAGAGSYNRSFFINFYVVVGHLVNVKEKSLSIYVDGKFVSKIYDDLEFPLWPAISIWGRGIVTADFGAKIPVS
jgi:hypothetical protein